MKLLVFDTCFNKSYIVLKDNGNVLSYKKIESTDSNYHSAYLIPNIRDILCTNNLLIKDLDAIAVNIGPGSFTGIRAGITIARVLAQQACIKLVGISSMEILSKLNKNLTDTIVVLDARKNNVYFAQYSSGKEIKAPSLKEKETLPDILKNYNGCIVSDNSISSYLSSMGITALNYEENDEDLGLFLSDIAMEKLSDSESTFNWAEVKPLYIQMPSITRPKVRNNV